MFPSHDLRGGGAYFHPDDRGNNTSDSNYIADNRGDESYCPDVPASVTSYKIRSNDFRSVDLRETTSGSVDVVITNSSDGSLSKVSRTLSNGSYSFKRAPNLTELDVGGNYYLDDAQSSGNFNLASKDKLVSVNYDSTNLGVANMQNSQSLQSYSQTYARGSGANPLVSGTSYLFENCSALGSWLGN